MTNEIRDKITLSEDRTTISRDARILGIIKEAREDCEGDNGVCDSISCYDCNKSVAQKILAMLDERDKKKAVNDLNFLKEMKDKFQTGIDGDMTQTQYAMEMLNDWIHEVNSGLAAKEGG